MSPQHFCRISLVNALIKITMIATLAANDQKLVLNQREKLPNIKLGHHNDRFND